jgi:hypothetical protein
MGYRSNEPYNDMLCRAKACLHSKLEATGNAARNALLKVLVVCVNNRLAY